MMIRPFLRLLLSGALALAVPAAAAGSSLRIMQSEAPRSMDPANQTATFTASVLDPLYEGLVRLEPDGRIVPLLATSWSESADGLDWRFPLRSGVRFHDGSPLDAGTAAASFRRLLSPTRGLAGAGRFAEIIEDVRPDGDALLIRLRRRYALLLVLLAQSQAALVSPQGEREGSLDRIADGTGPYRLLRWASGDAVEEVRNQAYWGRPPVIDRLVWRWSPEASVMNMALRTGEIDLAVPFSPVFANGLAATPGFSLHRDSGAASFFVALNNRLKPLDDDRVRRALSLATDRSALVAGLLHGYGVPSCAPLQPALAGCGNALPVLEYDPGRARALLAAAGLPHGFTLSVATQAADEPVAEALQAMWARIGVRLLVRRLEGGVWTDAAFAGPAAKLRADLGAVMVSWSAPFLPDMQLRPLYATASASPAGANLGFFSDPLIDRAIDAAAQTADPALRTQQYQAIARRLDDEVPVILLHTPADLVALRSGVRGTSVLPGGEIQVRDAFMTSGG